MKSIRKAEVQSWFKDKDNLFTQKCVMLNLIANDYKNGGFCDCLRVIELEYVKLIDKLKKANLLQDGFKPMCCHCYARKLIKEGKTCQK